MAQFNKNTYNFLGNNRSLFETVMIADQYGNMIGAANPSGMAVDAFGRARFSQPFTLFDSSHRYQDNGQWETAVSSNGAATFSASEGLVNMVVDTTSGSEVLRETRKVFSYQPGKSLQILNTFVMNEPRENLRQRVGYFGVDNGIYLELDGEDLYFVRRSKNTGTVVNTRIHQDEWNIDNLRGEGPSGFTLDISKAQIMFIDIEWLGVGSVRCGFVINGAFVHVHSFHHANIITSTYMTTASLPLRYEIKNEDTMDSSSTLKQICSTVISEGGYELYGEQYGVGTAIDSAYALTTAATFYPVVSIRLKSNHLDAVVIPSAISLLGQGNGINYQWKILESAAITTVAWTSAGADSAIEYTISGTALSGGRTLASGYISSTNQSAGSIEIPKDQLFKFQLGRNSFTSTPTTFTLAVTAGSNSQTVFGSMDWEEVTR